MSAEFIYYVVVILLAVLHLVTSSRVDELERAVDMLRKDELDD